MTGESPADVADESSSIHLIYKCILLACLSLEKTMLCPPILCKFFIKFHGLVN